LTSINVDADNTAYVSENGVLFNKSKTALISYPAGKSGSYAIPASVTAIGNGAFLRCYGLTSVTIPASVTAINDYVFFYCHSLTSVTIPASATAIGRWAFAFCSGLTSITIPASVTDISNCAFYGCSGLTSVTNLSLTPQNIGGDVFSEVNTITCTLRVPTSAVAAYKIAEGWRDFRTIQGGALATGVEDQPLAASVSLYPNPFASEVRLTGAAGCTLTVVTAAGAVVHTQKVAGAAETIALGKLPSGAYFFRLEKDGRKTAKIMINV
jgi:hypothetical protein